MTDKELREELVWLGRNVLEELSAHRLLGRTVRREGRRLVVGEAEFDLGRFRRVVAVGFGKAASAMAEALEEILGDFLWGGLVITEVGQNLPHGRIQVAEGGHPIPNERTLSASQALLRTISGLGLEDLLIVLVSGGGSALFEIPAPGISLSDLAKTTEALLRSGANISEMNVVRKHLSAVKGGQLLFHTRAGTVLVLVLSDVPGDDLGTIASGPTFPDPSTFSLARKILWARGIWENLPQSVREHILRGERGEVPETPKPGDPVFAKVFHFVLGSGRLAAELAQKLGAERGFTAPILTTTMRGEVKEVAKVLASLAEEQQRFSRPFPLPALVILAGETTVQVRGTGKGGRNQELALAFALEVAGRASVALLTLATDGRDGPTDAGGALVDGGTAERIRAGGIDPAQALRENDAYRALAASGDLLFLGPTGTNVADLVVLAVGKEGGC